MEALALAYRLLVPCPHTAFVLQDHSGRFLVISR